MLNGPSFDATLIAARAELRAGATDTVRQVWRRLSDERPDHVESALVCARLHAAMGEYGQAHAVLRRAWSLNPEHEPLAVELATVAAAAGDLPAATDVLRMHLSRRQDSPMAWLTLSQVLGDRGDGTGSTLAGYSALDCAQRMGVWSSPEETPPAVVPWVRATVEAVRANRRAVFEDALVSLAKIHPPAAMARVMHAVAVYLGERQDPPPHSDQRPRFFYFPGLSPRPVFDPCLQPWAPRLAAALQDIRREAATLLAGHTGLQDFIEVGPEDRIDRYLGGDAPSWEAFFFYRHGRRHDDNHRLCPGTSAVLESLDLVRIAGQTPEICFSVLAPGTHILPHHGVTNTRLVMHLPLQVPAGCALRIAGHGEHVWREGELVMFDDTYLHEAWNHGCGVRVVLLMDCWHPELTAPEREAVALIAQVIGTLDVALSSGPWARFA